MARSQQAVAYLERASQLSRKSRPRITSMVLLTGRGQALASQGRIGELADVAEALLDAASLSASSIFLSWAMALKCVLELRRGDLYAAVRFGEWGLSASAQSGSPLTGIARACLAEALLEIGEPQRCRELLTEEGAPRRPAFPVYEALYCELLLGAALALGDADRAAALAEQASQAAASLEPLRIPLAHATRARALLLLEQGEAVRAAEQALESVRAGDQAGALVETAHSRILAGRALAAAGQRKQAVAELR